MTSKDQVGPDPSGEPTVLGLTLRDRLLFIIGAPALGLVLGFYLPRIADWATTLPWMPLEGPFRLIGSLDGFWAAVGFVVVGVALGLFAAFAVFSMTLKVTLTDTEIRLDKDDKTRTFARSDVGAVFVEGKRLVLLDRESRELAREELEASAEDAERAFRARGYPWQVEDPHGTLFRRWVPDLPDLPGAVNALLKARENALKKKSAEDADDLRTEVQKLGYVVRDEKLRQYVRPLVRS